MIAPQTLTDWEGGVIEARPPETVTTPWMLTFADLVSLMLTFFVLMFALSGVKGERWDQLADSLSRALNPPLVRPADTGSAIRNNDRVQTRPGNELTYLASLLSNVVAEVPALGGAAVTLEDNRLTLTLPPQVVFVGDTAAVAPGAGALLTALAQATGGIGNQMSVMVTDADSFAHALGRAGAFANALRAEGFSRPLRVLGAVDGRTAVALTISPTWETAR